MNAEQAKQFKANVLKSRQMIPYSVADVVEFRKEMENNPDLTMDDFLRRKGLIKSKDDKSSVSVKGTGTKEDPIKLD